MTVSTIGLNDGSAIPWLAWGNGTGESKKEALELGKAALKAGISHIDTAQLYKTEEATGESLKETSTPRDSVYITSKIGTAFDTDEEIRQSVEESIKKLGSVPDLFLIHNPFPAKQDRVVPTWKVLEQLKDEGRLKSLGVSNFRPQDLEKVLKIAKHKPTVNQMEFHPFVLTHLEPVLKIQQEHGIVTEAYGPLTPLLRHPEKGGPLKPVLEKIAKRLGTDEATALLLWLKAKKVVAVTTSANAERIKGLGKAAHLDASLTPEEVAEIEEVGKKIHYRYYDEHMTVDFPLPNLPGATNSGRAEQRPDLSFYRPDLFPAGK